MNRHLLSIVFLIIALSPIFSFADPAPPEIIISNNLSIVSNEAPEYGPLVKKYPLRWMIDQRTETAWVYELPEKKLPIITINVPTGIAIDTISIINGYAKSKSLYNANNRIRKIKIVYSNGDDQEENLINSMAEQYIKLKKKISGKIHFVVTGFELGKKYNDFCISEFQVYSSGRPLINSNAFIEISGGEYPQYNLKIDEDKEINFGNAVCDAFFFEKGNYAAITYSSERSKRGVDIINLRNENSIDVFSESWLICGSIYWSEGKIAGKAIDPANNKTIKLMEKLKLP